MNDDVDALHADAEEPAGFDHFKAFVEECGGVDGDLRAHFPSRVLECLGEGDVGDLVGRQRAEGAAGRGENQPGDFRFAAAMAVEALENRVVFAIDGQEFDAALFRRSGDDFTCHDEDFLGGDGEIFACLDSR